VDSDRKLDSTETKSNTCIGIQMPVIHPTACHFTDYDMTITKTTTLVP